MIDVERGEFAFEAQVALGGQQPLDERVVPRRCECGPTSGDRAVSVMASLGQLPSNPAWRWSWRLAGNQGSGGRERRGIGMSPAEMM
jgi:hypothetical protein